MAILKGMRVNVVVAGKKLTEYDDNNDHDSEADNARTFSSMTKYVEVSSNTNFGLKFRCTGTTPSGCDRVQFDVYLDGSYMENALLESRGSRFMRGRKMCKNKNWTIEKFRFADIATDEAQNGRDPQLQASNITNLGIITVKVTRKVALGEVKDSDTRDRPGQLEMNTAVTEKSLKGQSISHRTSLDAPEYTTPVQKWRCKTMDLDEPYATFFFKYRSHKALQAEHIIPRTPSPIPLELRPRESLSREEMLELIEKLHQVPIKPEIKADHGLPPSLKRERDPEVEEMLMSARSNKVARKVKEIEVVDLLDD